MDSNHIGAYRTMNRIQVLGFIFYANGKAVMIINALNESSDGFMFALSLALSMVGIVLLFVGAKDE